MVNMCETTKVQSCITVTGGIRKEMITGAKKSKRGFAKILLTTCLYIWNKRNQY